MQTFSTQNEQLTTAPQFFFLLLFHIHIVWFGLVWFGLVWFGLVWFGLVWLTVQNRMSEFVSTCYAPTRKGRVVSSVMP
jgi:hypothetical protein